VASDEEVAGLLADMAHDLERPAQVVGHVALEGGDEAGVGPGVGGGDVGDGDAGWLIVAETESTGAELVVVSSAGLASQAVVHEIAVVHEAGVRVRSLSDFYQDWMGKLPAGEVERSSLLFDIGEVHGRGYSRVKRLFDVLGASVMLLPLMVLAPLVWLANSVGNRGPLFYRQVRVGRNGEEFSMLKFRTMTPHAGGTHWTVEGDPRITPVGRWLRRSHLDELPQAVNVLRGELSLVGPRPEQPAYVAHLVQRLPYYGLRHVVRPGLTGWAQVKYPYGASEEDAFEKLQFDFFYLRHQGLTMDLLCIARTLRTVTGATGR
jgi:lipopolysaccharide/colanic/teichoic acid biosynthesis glycosyltransferase